MKKRQFRTRFTKKRQRRQSSLKKRTKIYNGLIPKAKKKKFSFRLRSSLSSISYTELTFKQILVPGISSVILVIHVVYISIFFASNKTVKSSQNKKSIPRLSLQQRVLNQNRILKNTIVNPQLNYVIFPDAQVKALKKDFLKQLKNLARTVQNNTFFSLSMVKPINQNFLAEFTVATPLNFNTVNLFVNIKQTLLNQPNHFNPAPFQGVLTPARDSLTRSSSSTGNHAHSSPSGAPPVLQNTGSNRQIQDNSPVTSTHNPRQSTASHESSNATFNTFQTGFFNSHFENNRENSVIPFENFSLPIQANSTQEPHQQGELRIATLRNINGPGRTNQSVQQHVARIRAARQLNFIPDENQSSSRRSIQGGYNSNFFDYSYVPWGQTTKTQMIRPPTLPRLPSYHYSLVSNIGLFLMVYAVIVLLIKFIRLWFQLLLKIFTLLRNLTKKKL